MSIEPMENISKLLGSLELTIDQIREELRFIPVPSVAVKEPGNLIMAALVDFLIAEQAIERDRFGPNEKAMRAKRKIAVKRLRQLISGETK